MLALALAGWQWGETRLRLSDTQQEMARRLAESDTVAKESRELAIDGRPRDEASDKSATTPQPTFDSLAYWKELAALFWRNLRGLVRIQCFDRDEPALLAPGQDFFLRENLKLRLLNARLVLLARDQWTFRNDLKLAEAWIDRYFDTHEKSVQAAQATLRQLTATEVSVALPTLNDSISAIKSFSLGKERR